MNLDSDYAENFLIEKRFEDVDQSDQAPIVTSAVHWKLSRYRVIWPAGCYRISEHAISCGINASGPTNYN